MHAPSRGTAGTRLITEAISLQSGVPVGMQVGGAFRVSRSMTRVWIPSSPVRRCDGRVQVDGIGEGRHKTTFDTIVSSTGWSA